MQSRPLRIFVSSTTDDLGAVRAKVAEAIVRLGHVPVYMDTFGAGGSLGPGAESVDRVNGCDMLICLLGFRYGSVTEMEYNAAVSSAIKIVLAYAPSAIFTGASQPAAFDHRQQVFIAHIQRESHTCGTYCETADLPMIVAADLHRVVTGGVEGIIAYRKGLRELHAENYDSAIEDLRKAVYLLSGDGAPAFLLALAGLRGQRPRSVTLNEVRYVESLLQIATNLSPSRAVYAFWGALKQDFYLHHGFPHPHTTEASSLWRQALNYGRDPDNFELIFWLQPKLAEEYLRPFVTG